MTPLSASVLLGNQAAQQNYAAQGLQNAQGFRDAQQNYAVQGLQNAQGFRDAQQNCLSESTSTEGQTTLITVNVIVRQETEADRFWRSADAWGKAITHMWNLRIQAEQAKGNPFFANVETQDQYVEACRLTEEKKRRDLGFWKYLFGS